METGALCREHERTTEWASALAVDDKFIDRITWNVPARACQGQDGSDGPPGAVRAFLKSLGLLSVTVLAYLVLLEISVRYVIDDGMQYDLEMWKYAKELKRVSDDPGIGHEHRPSASARLMGVDVAINTTGQRGREFARPKPDRTFRILMLGDSLTFGWGVESKHTVAERLASRLKDGRSDLE